MPELNEHTVAELDELAEANAVEEYPANGNKAEKVAALEAAGVEGEGNTVYRLQLRDDYFDEDTTPVASFMVSEAPKPSRSVTLHEGEIFETQDYTVYVGLRDLPFLEEVA